MIAVAFYRAQVIAHDAVGGIGIHADCYAQLCRCIRFADRASNDLSR
jgi:hypothetical protein